MTFYTYIVECKDGTLYTGWTVDLEVRLAQHNSGKGAKYTSSRHPVILKAHWIFDTKSSAMQFEYKLKQLSRKEKLALIVTADPQRT